MKAKVNLNSDALKKFFVTHGEKIGFATMLALAGWIGYSASQIPVYGEGNTAGFSGGGKPKTSKDLSNDIQAAEQNVKNSHTRMDLAQDKVAPPKEKFIDIVQRLFLSRINPGYFGGIEWNRPLQDTKSRRTEPSYLAAADV